MSRIEDAKNFAKKAHGEQTRFDKKPYYSHPFTVAEAVSKLTNDEDVIIAAILHDVIEDTNVTYEQIKERFGERVVSFVMELTKDKNGKFSRVRSDEAFAVKCVDRAHNFLTLETIPDSHKKDRDELRKKYKKNTKF